MYDGFMNAVELDFTDPINIEQMQAAFAKVDEEKGLTCPLVIGGERIYTYKKITSVNLNLWPLFMLGRSNTNAFSP